MVTTDFLVIGGGVIGINIAMKLKKRFSDLTVTVIEKERECGLHASGRNSGVLHAGFYYSPDSLKARFTRDGNRLLTQYCEARKLAINKCGKLVVARTSSDLVQLDTLLKRGRDNGIELYDLKDTEAKAIEPRVRTYERAIFSPTTSTVNPFEVLQAMKHDALEEGVKIRCGEAYVKRQRSSVMTSSGVYQAGYIVNAAGLHADRVAREYGFSASYRILPFKGLYLYSDDPIEALRTNVYPAPDLENPFLGVHCTVTADGRTKVGPTAIPVLWREQYNGWQNFSFSEFMDLAKTQASLLLLSGRSYRRLAVQELQKCSRSKLVSLASQLVEGMREERYIRWAQPGIRAQLVDIKRHKLEMDFVLEGDNRSMHVLNAVSPGFTCAIPFSEYVCKTIEEKVSSIAKQLSTNSESNRG